MQKADGETLRRTNRALLLHRLREHDLSRTALASQTGLSNSAVSGLIAALVKEGTVFEKSYASSSGGRRPVLLSINPSAASALLIRLTAGGVETAVSDLSLAPEHVGFYPFAATGEEAVRSAILQAVGDAMRAKAPRLRSLAGVGVSTTGLVDRSSGIILYSSMLELRDFDVRAAIRPLTDAAVHVFKDTDAQAIGEFRLNRFRDDESYLFVMVGAGVGLSFINHGQIMRLNRSGMELGHLQLLPGGPKCSCGRLGCVEACVSERAALRDFTALKDAGERSACVSPRGYGDLVRASNDGDALARRVLTQQGVWLGRAVALAVNLFAPSAVLIASRLGAARWDLAGIVRDEMRRNVLEIFRPTEIRFSSLDETPSCIGMASQIFESEFYAHGGEKRR